MKSNSNNNLHNQDSGCKIFVGGLTWNTTKEMLHNEFSKYGEIVDSIVMKNPETGNSRGFGFVTYKDNISAENAVNSGSHKIDGKIVDVKLCNPRLAAQQRNTKQKSDNCKVFVGGLPHGVTDEQIKQFFSRYGLVKEFKMMYDENKQRPRGFGFITFDSEESANQVLQEHYIQFNGKQIEVKPQIHNVKQQNPYQQQHHMQYAQPQYGGGGNWNQNWNQQGWGQQAPQHAPLGQPLGIPNPNAPNGGAWGGAGGPYNPNLPNPAAINQQWGYPAHGSQPVPYANGGGAASAQSNWNYNYYGQPQPGYYEGDSSGTGNFYDASQMQQSTLTTTTTMSPTPSTPLSIYMPAGGKTITFDTTTTNEELFQSTLKANEFLQDSAFLPAHQLNYKQSSSSSIAGTIGSNANYSDSEASSHSYYRGNSLGSNSSLAPSVSSLTSSSLVSNVSGNSSSSSTRSNNSSVNTGMSHQNRQHINIQPVPAINNDRPHGHRNFHHHNRSGGGGSVASSSATDISSIYSSATSQLNSDPYAGSINEHLYGSGANYLTSPPGSSRQLASSSYHPYRR